MPEQQFMKKRIPLPSGVRGAEGKKQVFRAPISRKRVRRKKGIPEEKRVCKGNLLGHEYRQVVMRSVNQKEYHSKRPVRGPGPVSRRKGNCAPKRLKLA